MVLRVSRSLTCKVISKQGLTVQPIVVLLLFWIDIEKLDSASQNPVTHHGLKIDKV